MYCMYVFAIKVSPKNAPRVVFKKVVENIRGATCIYDAN